MVLTGKRIILAPNGQIWMPLRHGAGLNTRPMPAQKKLDAAAVEK